MFLIYIIEICQKNNYSKKCFGTMKFFICCGASLRISLRKALKSLEIFIYLALLLQDDYFFCNKNSQLIKLWWRNFISLNFNFETSQWYKNIRSKLFEKGLIHFAFVHIINRIFFLCKLLVPIWHLAFWKNISISPRARRVSRSISNALWQYVKKMYQKTIIIIFNLLIKYKCSRHLLPWFGIFSKLLVFHLLF